jgi:transcriptional regulator with XRE-family HTH domain
VNERISIGEKIRKLRLEMNYTQKDIQQGTGIPQSNLSELERGRFTPQIKTLRKIADFLGINLSYLLDVDDTNLDDIRLNIRMNKELSEEGKNEILDFIDFVKQKEEKGK